MKHKYIRRYDVTPANIHDSNVFDELLDPRNSSHAVWADSAYRSQETLDRLKENGYREHLQRKGIGQDPESVPGLNISSESRHSEQAI